MEVIVYKITSGKLNYYKFKILYEI